MGGAGRRAGLAAAPALPRPGRRGRSVGAARPAHLAGSHPSARRGARRERGPGRRGRAALTRRTAEAPARRQSASRPAGARRASSAGDEPLAHPARNAAAAGRLHCLTAARAGVAASLQCLPWCRARSCEDSLVARANPCPKGYKIRRLGSKASVALQPLWALLCCCFRNVWGVLTPGTVEMQ
ncbi:uncharacterized protein LOC118602805 isoform X3 [Rousettus aegyptiacus]|uniref:uncharacterized protein LOC118602805 isoform X3 n=1 Tax=Rousettus aegyptiacus TaxID=9407 RepID=UPI00168D78BD|nr:uncharacterized protein LOC118602805 isoform X3 [Rousettus aegyptiacus]